MISVKMTRLFPAPSLPSLHGNKIEAYKNAKVIASRVEVEPSVGGFITHTHYPQKESTTAVHGNLHSVNQHLRSTLGSPKGNTRNE